MVDVCEDCKLQLAPDRKTRNQRVGYMYCAARFSPHYELQCKRVAVARLRSELASQTEAEAAAARTGRSPVAEPPPLVEGEPDRLLLLTQMLPTYVKGSALHDAVEGAFKERDALKQQLDYDRQLYEKDVARLEAEREPVAGEADVDTNEASYKRTTSTNGAEALWPQPTPALTSSTVEPSRSNNVGTGDARFAKGTLDR